MSKRNKNKQKFSNQAAPVQTVEKSAEEKAEKNTAATQQVDTIKKDFRNLAIIVIFLIVLLFALYFYNKQTHVLQYFTTKLFSLF